MLCVEPLLDELPVFIDILLAPFCCMAAIIMACLGVKESPLLIGWQDVTLSLSTRFLPLLVATEDPPSWLPTFKACPP